MYKAGIRKTLMSSRVNSPLTMTSANGRCESVPTPVASATGSSPKAATSAVIMIGRNRRIVVHGTGQIAPFDRELHADVARVVLTIDERGAVGHANIREFLERYLLAARRGNQDIADFVGIVAVRLIEACGAMQASIGLGRPASHRTAAALPSP
jgi:hypothetical protein